MNFRQSLVARSRSLCDPSSRMTKIKVDRMLSCSDVEALGSAIPPSIEGAVLGSRCYVSWKFEKLGQELPHLAFLASQWSPAFPSPDESQILTSESAFSPNTPCQPLHFRPCSFYLISIRQTLPEALTTISESS
jgi:hypothetical protein